MSGEFWFSEQISVFLISTTPSYLLSIQTSPLGGIGAPSARLTLIGSDSPGLRRNFHLHVDAIRYTETIEFALSLLPPPAKEPFGGLVHLQSYKLLCAWQLAELKEATKLVHKIFFNITFSFSPQILRGD